MLSKLVSKNTILGLMAIIMFAESRIQQDGTFIVFGLVLIAIQFIPWQTREEKARRAVREMLPQLNEAASLMKSETVLSPETARRAYKLITAAEAQFVLRTGEKLPEFQAFRGSLFGQSLATGPLDSDTTVIALSVVNDLLIRLIHYT